MQKLSTAKSRAITMRIILVLLALVALSLAGHGGEGKHGGRGGKGKHGGKYIKEMGKERSKVYQCLAEGKQCMEKDDSDALKCYNDHLECMKKLNLGDKKMEYKKDKMLKMFPKIAQFKTCFKELDTCAKDGNDEEVKQCALEMRECMKDGKPENMDYLGMLPMHVQKAVRRYLRCSQGKGNMADCVRDHISAVKRMNYGYQVANCINKIFTCQNKVDSNAEECCASFMGCKNAITEEAPKTMTEKEKRHPIARKARAMEQCLETFEEQHGKVSDEECLNEFTSCIVKVQMPMVPAPKIKHGYCLKNLNECKPADADAAKVCMKDYQGCLGGMVHRAVKRKDAKEDDE